jgi:hypothetical protein
VKIMQYSLILNDAQRAYLVRRVEAGLVAHAGKLPTLDAKRNPTDYEAERADLHTAAAILASLSPGKLEVATDAAPVEREQECIHAVPVSKPCAACDESTESINARMSGRATP